MPRRMSTKAKRKIDRKLILKLESGRRLPSVWSKGVKISSQLTQSQRVALADELKMRWARSRRKKPR